MDKKCKIIIFSDIHYMDKRPKKIDYNFNRKLTQYSITILEKLIDKINNMHKPDVVINLGDLIEDTLNKERDLKNLEYIWKRLSGIRYPFYSAIGNHDLRSMKSIKEVTEIMGYKYSTFSINMNGYHFVILSTDIRNEVGTENGGIFKTHYVSEQDIKWLKEDLEKNKLPCIICTHFGLAEDDMIGNYWFSSYPELGLLKNRKEVKNIIRNDKNILAIFSGHQHWTKFLEEEGIKYYQLGSLIENIEENGIKQFQFGPLTEKIEGNGKPDGVYFEVNIENKNVEVIEHHIQIT